MAAAQAPLAARLQRDAGLPSPDTARALLATACVAVWAPNLSVV
jgi:hypothetical protein